MDQLTIQDNLQSWLWSYNFCQAQLHHAGIIAASHIGNDFDGNLCAQFSQLPGSLNTFLTSMTVSIAAQPHCTQRMLKVPA